MALASAGVSRVSLHAQKENDNPVPQKVALPLNATFFNFNGTEALYVTPEAGVNPNLR